MRITYLGSIVLLLFSVEIVRAAEPILIHLYQQLERPTYKLAFDRLFEGQKGLAPWVEEFIKTGNGVSSPGEMRKVGQALYEVYTICQPHNCPGHKLVVTFSIDRKSIAACSAEDGQEIRFFGEPSAEVKQMLLEVASTSL